MDKIEMVMINGDTVVKKQFEILDKDGVISFELGKLTLAVRKEDLKKIFVGGTNE